MSDEDKQALIKSNPAYGRVICRCEGITEGEIIESLKGPLGAVSLDGVKRRVRPGSGRCQGGFCGPKVIEIISRELKIKPWEVPLDLDGSYVLGGEQYD
jgi:glycerol-3-phosphate dehydrogenase